MSQSHMYGALLALIAAAAAAALTASSPVIDQATSVENEQSRGVIATTLPATFDESLPPAVETTLPALVQLPTTPTRPSPGAPTTTSPVAQGAGWQLVWSDEFDRLDPTKWRIEHSTYGNGNGELQCYQPRNVVVEAGVLHLVAEEAAASCPKNEQRAYSSGMLRSQGLADWTYGRFEVRARFPEGDGFWPAAWLSPSSPTYGTWPHSGELDIVEALGSRTDRIVGSLHWMGPRGKALSNREYFLPPGGSFSDAFHTFAVEWEADSIAWFVDDIEYHRVSAWPSTAADHPAPFNQPFYLKLNLAVGGGAAGAPTNATGFPASYEIDWVRVYQR